MVDFTKLMNTKMEDIEAPLPLPTGTYLFKVSDPYEDNDSADDRFKFINFPCEVLEAGDQIDDPQALEEYGNPAGKKLRVRFMFNNGENLTGEEAEKNDKAASRMRKFLEDALEIEADTMKDAMTEAVGRQFYGVVRHRKNDQNPDEPFVEISNTGPVD